ncbi:MAG: endonuclease/exonuclease/phosphatase family protein, partial [Bacteroidales bacterium]
MTHLRLLFLSLFLNLSWLVFDGVAQASDTLRVATFNVRVDTGGDTGNRDWDMRKAHVADIIKNLYQFDIFGVQELTSSTQLNELMAYLSDTYNVFSKGIGNTAGTSGTRNAIIYKKSRLTLLNSGGFFLSPTPDVASIGWDAKLNRICVWAKMLDNATNKQFYFFNAHFDHVGDEARRQSAKLIIAKIAEINGIDNLPVFFVGDLNTQPDKIPISSIINGGMTDSRTLPLAKNIFGSLGTTNGWNKDPAVLTNRIDYIFVNDKADVHAYYTINKKYYTDAYPSDHFPVMIKTVLTNKVVIPRIKSDEVLLGEYAFTTGADSLKPSRVQSGFQLSDIYIAPDLLQASCSNDAIHLTNWSTSFQMTAGKSVQFTVIKNSAVLQYDVTRVDIKLQHGGSDGIVMHFGTGYNSGTRTTNLNTMQISKDSMVTVVMQEGMGSNVTPTPVVADNNPFYLGIGTRSPLTTDIVSIDHIKVYGTVTSLSEDFSGYDAVAVTGDLTQAPRIANDVPLSKQPGWSAQNVYAFKAGTGFIATLLLGPTATDSAYITTPALDLSQPFLLNFGYRSRMGGDINPDGRLNVYLNDSLLIWEGQTTLTTIENISSIAFVGTPDSKITFTVPTVAGNEMMFDNVTVVRSSQPALNLPLYQTIDLGTVPLNSSKNIQIPLSGGNLSRDLSVSLSDGVYYQITSPSEIDKATAEAGTQIVVNFTPPASPGLYTDTIMVGTTNMTARTIILQAIHDHYNAVPQIF